jgi:putative flippase GtrA
VTTAPTAHAPHGVRTSFALFVLAAAASFVVDAGVLTALVRAAHWTPWPGRLVSFPLAVTVSWWLNRRYAFRGRRPGDGRVEYAGYWLIQLAGAAVNFALFGLCLHLVPALAAWPFVPVAVGGIAAMVFNFAVARSTLYRAVNSAR